MEKKLKRNIRTYYWYSTFAELLILGPVLVLFLTAKKLSFTEIMLLQSISAVSVVFFEVPTGAVADKFGRKTSILCGSFFWALSLLLYILGTNFAAFAAAEIIFSLGAALKSGADSALIYDSLKILGRQKEYQAIEGKARANALYAQAIGSIIAGFVYAVNIMLPMAISIFFMILTMVISMSFHEPPVQDEDGHEPIETLSYLSQIKDSGKFIFNNEKLKAITIFCMMFFIFYRAGFWFYQPYMEAVNLPVRYFGIIFFVFNITAAFFSKRSYYIMGKTKPKTLTFMALLMIASFVLLGVMKAWIGVAAILLQQVARGIYRPVTTKYLNKHIPSNKRATILSFNSLLCNIAVAVTFPFIGLLKDHTTVYSSHLILALIMAILTVLSVIYMNSRLGVKPSV